MSRHSARSAAWQRFRRRLLEAARAPLRASAAKVSGRLEVHHIKPLARGGGNEPENLQVVCRGCHIGIHRRRRPEPPGRAAWIRLRDALR